VRYKSPEKIVLDLCGVFLLCGWSCFGYGYVFDQEVVTRVGVWLLICAILTVALPVTLAMIVVIIDKLRSK
jgi:hypothetical protein